MKIPQKTSPLRSHPSKLQGLNQHLFHQYLDYTIL